MEKKVTIAMAVYNPRMDWLEEQLRSIEGQDYKNIELIALDDASSEVPYSEIEDMFSRQLNNVPYKLYKNSANIGSDRTFEQLTKMADGAYISYCDQDDIWEPQKTGELVSALEQTGAELAYSGLSVIDSEGSHVVDSLLEKRRRLKYYEGAGLASILLFRNFTNGTAMIVRTETAKSALPFVTDMVADHWLTLWCALNGKLALVQQPLVQYRLHGSNQSAVMAGVRDKRSYLERRIFSGLSRFNQYEARLAEFPEFRELISCGKKWFEARRDWFEDGRGAKEIWAMRYLGKQVSAFELVAARLPEPLFIAAVRLVQRGVL